MNKELFPPVKFTPDEIKAMKEFIEKIKVNPPETNEFSPEATQATNS